VSDLNKISETKTLSFIDIIINFWKFKKFFFYILTTLVLLSFLIENQIPRKAIIEIQLKDPIRINSDFIPSKLLTRFVSVDLPTIFLKKMNLSTDRLELDFYNSYFLINFLSSKNLNDFAKLNNKKYNLQEYISKNDVAVTRMETYLKEAKNSNNYHLILPDNDNNKNFFNEYFIYTLELSIEIFEEEVIRYGKEKIELMEKDIAVIDQMLENFLLTNVVQNEYVDGNLARENVYIIKNLYKSRKISINDNISYLKNIKNNYDYNNWIVDGPKESIVNYKAYKIISYIIPVILSLMIYLLLVLIKLQKQDK
jgi:hypothetical protein